MDCTCPSCASNQTQRLPVIHADGTLLTNGRPMKTAASFLAAPPKPRTYAGPLVVIFLAFLVIGDLVIARLPPNSWLVRSSIGNALQAAFLFLPLIVWISRVYRYNQTTWRRRLNQWQRSFRCNRCGRVFETSQRC
jgi:hypothetical protein